VADVLRALGVPGPVPLLGWAFDERWAAANRPAVSAFLRAAYAAKQILVTSDAEWERIQPLTGATDPAVLRALRDAFREGTPRRFGQAEIDAAAAAFAILAREGGEELVGPSRQLSPGTFWDGFRLE
jgi:NitT/TauT family transport system substrate-binding protein